MGEQLWTEGAPADRYHHKWHHEHDAELRSTVERLEGERDAAATFAQNVDDLRVARIAELESAHACCWHGWASSADRALHDPEGACKPGAALPDTEGPNDE